MLMALSLLYISLSLLIPAIDLVMQHNITESIRQKDHAQQVIYLHSDMVIYCQNNPDICNRKDPLNFDHPDFQQQDLYKDYLISEVYNSPLRRKLHGYSYEGRYFTALDKAKSSSDKIEENQLYISLNQYAPKYIGVGQVTYRKKQYSITFSDGTALPIDKSLYQLIGADTYVLVS